LELVADAENDPSVLRQARVCEPTKPGIWWKCVKSAGTINEEQCNPALKLMIMPASLASIERAFSNFSFIRNKLRNS